MSPRNCARLFRQELGKIPGKRIEDLRLEAARRQPEATSRTVEQIKSLRCSAPNIHSREWTVDSASR